MEKKLKVFICFLIGIVLTTCYWLSVSPLFTDFLIVPFFMIIIPLFVFLLQEEKFENFSFNIVSHILGITISLVIEIKFDFIDFLYQLSGSEMSAGDGFGLIIYTPLYICADVLIVILAFIATFIRSKRR